MQTVEDLLLRFPTRYEDRAAPCEIRNLRPGMTATVTAEVVSSGIRQTRRPGFRLFEAIVRDATGGITKAVFPNQAFLKDVFVPGQRVVLFGALEYRPTGGLQFTNPEYELIRAETHTCYLGTRGALHEWGHGCGTCPACELRERGYARYRAGSSSSLGSTTIPVQ